jgi:hypothetical protein
MELQAVSAQTQIQVPNFLTHAVLGCVAFAVGLAVLFVLALCIATVWERQPDRSSSRARETESRWRRSLTAPLPGSRASRAVRLRQYTLDIRCGRRVTGGATAAALRPNRRERR